MQSTQNTLLTLLLLGYRRQVAMEEMVGLAVTELPRFKQEVDKVVQVDVVVTAV